MIRLPLLRVGPSAATLLLLALTGCGSWGRPGNAAPQTGESLVQALDLGSAFRRIGRLTGTGGTPFVADLAFLAGPADSTVAVVAVSLENSNLSFQREGDYFVAHYRIQLSAQPDGGGTPVTLSREQSVRVSG